MKNWFNSFNLSYTSSIMDASLNFDTLRYFSNHTVYNKLFENTETPSDRYSKEDYRFYKRRIVQLFKDIVNKEEVDSRVKTAYEEFVYQAIEYLKFKDKSDMIQRRLEGTEPEERKPDPTKMPPFGSTIHVDSLLYQTTQTEKDTQETIDKQLDVVVTGKPKSTAKPVYPTNEINLRDPELKTKGLKSKKKKKKKKHRKERRHKDQKHVTDDKNNE